MSETHLQRHVARVEQWGEERGLYDTDSPLVQFGKMVEEVGELIMAIGKDDVEGIKDAIGDVRVCLIGVCKIADWSFGEESRTCIVPVTICDVLFWVKCICDCIENEREDYMILDVPRFNAVLWDIANTHDLTLEECDNHAWEQIKDRKGKTVNGEFIKEQK